MATVTGYTAEHLQDWLRSQQNISELITSTATIDDTEDILHTIAIPASPVPVILDVALVLTLFQTVAYDAFEVRAYVDAVEVGSVINGHGSGTGVRRGYVIPTTMPVTVAADDDTVEVSVRAIRDGGAGTATRDTDAVSLVTVKLIPDWTQF